MILQSLDNFGRCSVNEDQRKGRKLKAQRYLMVRLLKDHFYFTPNCCKGKRLGEAWARVFARDLREGLADALEAAQQIIHAGKLSLDHRCHQLRHFYIYSRAAQDGVFHRENSPYRYLLTD